ncbi:MAG: T9SS type A sorting domain-containing protein [bacterium]
MAEKLCTLKLEDAQEHKVWDTVKIEILPQSSGQKADYDFETADQLDDWTFQNWDQGGFPTVELSSEQAHSGSYSAKLSGDFITNSQNALKQTGSLEENIENIIYHIWVPQILVDSSAAVAAADPSKAGGIQAYLMHTGWDWRDVWVDIYDLEGDAWNQITFPIPEDVNNADIKETGLVCTLQNTNIGKSSIYIDDIYFNTAHDSTSVHDPNNELSTLPRDFKLFNNYPNPFNPETAIKYNLPQSTKVKIMVYDIAGHRVKTLVNEPKTAGRYEIIFDSSQLASGVYLYTLEAGKFREVKKMVLLK